jgi:hypothetical protein
MNSNIHKEAYEKLAYDLPDDLAVGVELVIRLHRNGSLSISGPIGEPEFCYQLLDHARDAIKRQTTERPSLVIPSYDVGLQQ